MPALPVDALVGEGHGQSGAVLLGCLVRDDRTEEGIAGHHIEAHIANGLAQQEAVAELANAHTHREAAEQCRVYRQFTGQWVDGQARVGIHRVPTVVPGRPYDGCVRRRGGDRCRVIGGRTSIRSAEVVLQHIAIRIRGRMIEDHVLT